jgi:hypothetical protein
MSTQRTRSALPGSAVQFHRDTSAGISAATVSAALYAPLTRQITFPTSSATSSAPSGASVTPTGRPVLARREGECNDSIGMADVEGVPDQRHAERLAHSLQKDFLDLGRAVAIRVAQPRDPVRG